MFNSEACITEAEGEGFERGKAESERYAMILLVALIISLVLMSSSSIGSVVMFFMASFLFLQMLQQKLGSTTDCARFFQRGRSSRGGR